jgi:hypothetical protein
MNKSEADVLQIWTECKNLLQKTAEGKEGKVDGREATLKAAYSNMANNDAYQYLQRAIDGLKIVLTRMEEKRSAAEKRAFAEMLSLSSSSDDDDDDDDDDEEKPKKKPRTEKTSTKTVTLENKPERHRQQAEERYMAAVGGKAAWKTADFFRTFLVNPSLPWMFGNRLTLLVNESPVINAAMELLKQEKCLKGIEKAELEKLGERVLAETSAKAVVLYAAYQKHIKDGYKWSEKTLSAALEQETKIMMAVSLRNAEGTHEKKSLSFGDLFNAKELNKEEDERVPRTGAPRTNHRPVRSQGTTKDPEWMLKKPENCDSQRCSDCKGWGHKSSNCVKEKNFGGYCSICHGKGHKASECPSKK